MKIKQVRDDIKEVARKSLSKHNFVSGKDGRLFKTDENGNCFSIMFLEVKDRSSFSISVNVTASFENVDKLFPKDETDPEFTLNCRLGSESISFDSYTKSELEDIIDRLTSSLAIPFLSRISTEDKVMENLSSEDSTVWITSDIVARYKFKFASAIASNDSGMLSLYLNETDKLLSKPWVGQYKTQLTKLCNYARKSM